MAMALRPRLNASTIRGPGWTFPWHPPAEGGDGGSGRGTAVGIPVVPENPGISRIIFFRSDRLHVERGN